MKTGKYKKKKHNSCKIISAACYCCAAFCLSYFVLLAVADYSLPYPGFSYVWPVGGVFFFAVGRFWQKRCRLIEHDVFMPLTCGQKFWNGLFVFILICMCSLSVYELQFILRPYNQPTVDANIRYVIVLGGGTRSDGTVGNVSAARLRTAADYMHKHQETVAILTEGKGPFSPEPGALGMKRYLEGRGILGRRILCETESQDTVQNFLYSAQVIAQTEGISVDMAKKLPVLIVTSASHLQRSLYLASQQGYENVYGLASSVPLLNVPNVYLREVCSMVKLQLREWIQTRWR